MLLNVIKVFQPEFNETCRVSLVSEKNVYKWHIKKNIIPKLQNQLHDVKINISNIDFFNSEMGMYTFSQIFLNMLLFNNFNFTNPVKALFDHDDHYVTFTYFLDKDEHITVPKMPDLEYRIKFLVEDEHPAMKIFFKR